MRYVALALAFALPGLASAQPSPAGGLGQKPPGAAGQGMMAPGAGMTLAQFQARQRTRMMRMDTDGDGRISLAEWTAWRTAHPGHAGGGRDPTVMFQRMDLNHDGYLTTDEIDAVSARRFARMDANHDGVVTPDERAAMRPGAAEPVEPLAPQ